MKNKRGQNRYGKFHIQNRNSADNNNDIMNQSDNASQCVAELKTPANINQHGQPRKNDGNNCFSLEIRTDFGTDDFHAPDFIVLIESGGQRLFHVGGQHLLIGERFRCADQKFFFTELLNDAAFQFCGLQGCPNLIGRNILLEFDLDNRTAGEINAEELNRDEE